MSARAGMCARVGVVESCVGGCVRVLAREHRGPKGAVRRSARDETHASSRSEWTNPAPSRALEFLQRAAGIRQRAFVECLVGSSPGRCLSALWYLRRDLTLRFGLIWLMTQTCLAGAMDAHAAVAEHTGLQEPLPAAAACVLTKRVVCGCSAAGLPCRAPLVVARPLRLWPRPQVRRVWERGHAHGRGRVLWKSVVDASRSERRRKRCLFRPPH